MLQNSQSSASRLVASGDVAALKHAWLMPVKKCEMALQADTILANAARPAQLLFSAV